MHLQARSQVYPILQVLHRDIGQKPCSCFIRRLLKSSLQDRKRQSAWSIPAIVRLLPSSANLEEFLVAVGLKDAVDFTVRERKEEFYRVSENRKETLVVAKNTWGYIEITVESDSPFVTVEKDLITTDYFLGSTMLLNYYMHKNRMHAH